MELSTYFQPVDLNEIVWSESDYYSNIASSTEIFAMGGQFPDTEGATLAIVGIGDDNGSQSADEIRRYL